MTEPQAKAAPKRRQNRMDRLTTAWMLIAVALVAVTIVFRGAVPQSWWTLIHVVTLGILTNSILQWSWYFAKALLRLPAADKRSGRNLLIRQGLFNLVLVGLIAAIWTANLWGVIAGAAGIGLIISWHGLALTFATRDHLGSRFAVVIRYYIVAAAFLVLGCFFAGFIAAAMFGAETPQWIVDYRSQLTLAHALSNGIGWIGLTMAGTLVTLGPTMLRTRMQPEAVNRAVKGLPFLAVLLVAAIIAVTFNLLWLAGILLAGFVAVLVWAVGIALLSEANQKSPKDYATLNVTAGIIWAVVGLTCLSLTLVFSPSVEEFREQSFLWVLIIGVGGMLPILVGALTYLMPVVIGGGPQPLKVGIRVLETAGSFRFSLRQIALLLAVLAPGSGLDFLWWTLLLITYIGDIVAFAVAGIKQMRARRERREQTWTPLPPSGGKKLLG